MYVVYQKAHILVSFLHCFYFSSDTDTELCLGSNLLLPRRTIIGSAALNDSVRNGKRCFHRDKPPRQNSLYHVQRKTLVLTKKRRTRINEGGRNRTKEKGGKPLPVARPPHKTCTFVLCGGRALYILSFKTKLRKLIFTFPNRNSGN